MQQCDSSDLLPPRIPVLQSANPIENIGFENFTILEKFTPLPERVPSKVQPVPGPPFDTSIIDLLFHKDFPRKVQTIQTPSK
jgi:hypothetical protein